jgi:hypothetical protein
MHRHIFDPQVWGIQDDSSFTVNLPGRPNTNRDYIGIYRQLCSF